MSNNRLAQFLRTLFDRKMDVYALAKAAGTFYLMWRGAHLTIRRLKSQSFSCIDPLTIR